MDIIAHRGASGAAPENTMLAFRLAWQLGVNGIELDVHMSRDGCIMVHHDATTQRCARVNLTITDTNSEVLCKLDVGRWRGAQFAGATMPRLDDVLTEAPAGSRVLIELKGGVNMVPALQQTLTAKDYSGLRIALISFDLPALIACHQALPELPYYPVFSLQDEDTAPKYSPKEWITIAQQHGFTGLDPDYRDIDKDFATAAQAAQLDLITWTVNDPKQVPVLDSLGVSAIATDWPEQLQQIAKTL